MLIIGFVVKVDALVGVCLQVEEKLCELTYAIHGNVDGRRKYVGCRSCVSKPVSVWYWGQLDIDHREVSSLSDSFSSKEYLTIIHAHPYIHNIIAYKLTIVSCN